MKKLHLPQTFSDCPVCRSKHSGTLLPKKSYPSKIVALHAANALGREECCKLYAYPCPSGSGTYHLSKQRNPYQVHFNTLCYSLKAYRILKSDYFYCLETRMIYNVWNRGNSANSTDEWRLV